MIRKCSFLCESPAQTKLVARLLAQRRQPGIRLLLQGSVGSGKSEFSRAFVREVYQDDTAHVPSPTYLLHQIYDDIEGPEIHHYDLYRMMEGGLHSLELAESFKNAVTLVEWAERLGNLDESFCRLVIHFYMREEMMKQRPEILRWKSLLPPEGDPDVRILCIEAYGEKHAQILTQLQERFPPCPQSPFPCRT